MRLDPRTKLLILAVTSVSVFVNKSIAVECVLAGIPLVLLSVSGNLKRMLKYAAFFLALLLIQLFIVPRLPVTFGGIVYMFAVYIRKLLPCFIQLKLPGFSRQCNGCIRADDMERNLIHHFWNDRVYLSWHNRGTILPCRKVDLSESCSRAGRH